MKYSIALLLTVLSSTSALASEKCQYGGTPDAFKFISWEFKKVDNRWTDIKLKFKNTLEQNVSWADVLIEVGGHSFGLRVRELVKAGGEGIAADQLGMPQKDADMFAPMTPVICVHALRDEKDNLKRFD